MDSSTADKVIGATHYPRTAVTVALSMLALFLLAATMAQLKGIRFIGSGVTASNTITVSGEGEVFAVPDIATFSVTVQEEAKDVSTAQTTATKKGNDIVAYLKNQGIEEKDIQTTDYNVYPQYDYVTQACPTNGGYCPPGKQTLRGYQVTSTLTVKVRDTKKAGTILSGVGQLGASSVSGLSFTQDDPKVSEAQARGKAIDDARTKADVLSKQLGVQIVRVVGFNENSGGPVYYGKAMTMSADAGMRAPEAPPAPDIQVGQNKITSNVSVTYEIQ